MEEQGWYQATTFKIANYWLQMWFIMVTCFELLFCKKLLSDMFLKCIRIMERVWVDEYGPKTVYVCGASRFSAKKALRMTQKIQKLTDKSECKASWQHSSSCKAWKQSDSIDMWLSRLRQNPQALDAAVEAGRLEAILLRGLKSCRTPSWLESLRVPDMELMANPFNPQDLILRPVRIASSKQAQQIYLNTVLLLTTSTVLLGLAAFAYILFYMSIPQIGIERVVHLQFGYVCVTCYS
jgi:hypothetical protein